MNEYDYLPLIYKRLEGVLSSEESKQLNAWLEASEENRAFAEEVESAWNASGNLGADPQVDLDAEFAELEEMMGEEEEAAPVAPSEESSKVVEFPTPQRNVTRWYAYAAAVILLAVAGFIFLPNMLSGGEPELEWISLKAGDEVLEQVLPDGSVLKLNAHSEAEYPREFAENERRVRLRSGMAYFKVTPDKDKPFITESPDLNVQVLGTEYFVFADPAVTGKSSVDVVEGRVEVSVANGESKVVLRKGESTRYSKSNGDKLSVVKSTQQSGQYWATKELVFENVPLQQVLEQLKVIDPSTVVLERPEMGNCPFTGTLKGPNIEDILKILAEVFDMEYVVTDFDEPYLLSGGQCN